MASHWMVFVNWQTIVRWKQSIRNWSESGGIYPYQYSSDSKRFLLIKPGDVLWLVTTPRFGAGGKQSLRGRARPPAVMARLRVASVCWNRFCDKAKFMKPPEIRFCDEVLPDGVHPASDAWSIVVVGEKDPENPSPLQVSYPVLYNFFGVLRKLKFMTQKGETDFKSYLEFVEAGQYLSDIQRKAKLAGRKVVNPGPYAAFGQTLQTLRRLTPASAKVMNNAHKQAVLGKRVFFSYKWTDVEHLAKGQGQTRKEWVRELNNELDQAGWNSWLDHHQVLTDDDIGDLLEEILADAVSQSVVFVALLSENYGTGWSLDEWQRAQKRLKNQKLKQKAMQLVLACGGDPERLGLTHEDTVQIGASVAPSDVVRAICEEIECRSDNNS